MHFDLSCTFWHNVCLHRECVITVFRIVKILPCFLIINFAYNLTYLIPYSFYVAATFCICVHLMFLAEVHSGLCNFLLSSYYGCINNRKNYIYNNCFCQHVIFLYIHNIAHMISIWQFQFLTWSKCGPSIENELI